jgi:hypothetical protein
MRTVWAAVLALCLLLSSRCSPCQGRRLQLAADEEGGKVTLLDGGLVFRVPSPASGGQEAAVPRKFMPRPERLMRSVPSPGVGH